MPRAPRAAPVNSLHDMVIRMVAEVLNTTVPKDRPVAVAIVWETAGRQVRSRSVPDLSSALRGLLEKAAQNERR